MNNTIRFAVAVLALSACAPSLVLVSNAATAIQRPGPAAANAPIVQAPSDNNTWSVGSDGWTVFRGSPGTGTCGNASSNYTGTCVVYVANSGNDATCAAQPLPVTSSPARPCATLSKAQTLLRDRSPDWVLLKKGDTWKGGVNGTTGGWNRNGRSAAEPMLISSYGTGARPLFKDGGLDTPCFGTIKTNGQYMAIVGIECYVDFADPASPSYLGVTATGDMSATSPTITNMASTNRIGVGYVAFGSGINGLIVQSVTKNSVTLNGNPGFTSAQRPIQFNKGSTSGGIVFNGVTNFVIVEDCKLRFGSLSLLNSGTVPVEGLEYRIRRNQILDAYGYVGRPAAGVFLGDNMLPTGKILFEENLVDHVGYNTSIWGAVGSIFSHNFYLHDENPSITFVRNIMSNASATGAQVRNGGFISNNLSLGNPIAFVTGPGVQFNETTYSYNVITEGSDIIAGMRNAIAPTAVGTKVLGLDAVLTGGNGAFVGKTVANLDNPGSVTGGVVSVTATTATLSAAVAAGKRGDGVKIGDRIVLYSPRSMGLSLGPSGTFSPAINIGGGVYPAGSNVFFFEGRHPLPAWIVPGMNLAVYNARTAFPGGQTKVASISADRLSLKTVDTSVAAITGGTQNVFAIWTPGDYSHFPKQTVGPNNVFTTSSGLSGSSYAYAPQNLTQNISSAGNYYYNWNKTPAGNIEEYGISGANINTPSKLNLSNSTAYPNATIGAYDKSIGGPGTSAHFIAQARMQSKDSWDPRYTANAANNFIRNVLGCNCAQ